jgi:hypothetical protein
VPERFCVLRSCVGGGRDILVLVISAAKLRTKDEARRIALNGRSSALMVEESR